MGNKATVKDAKLADMTDDQLLEAVKDPAVKELLGRRLPGQSKLARAARHPSSYPANEDPRLTRLG